MNPSVSRRSRSTWRLSRWGTVAAFVSLAGLLASSCAKTSGGEGSETHFAECERDADCREHGPGARCVDSECHVPSAECERDSDCAEPGTFCDQSRCRPRVTTSCDAGAPFECVQFCGSDFVNTPSCSSDGWTCPDGFVPLTECDPNECGGLVAPCCANDGSEVPRDCVDGRSVCPPGATPREGETCSNECAVATDLSPPYPVTFRFTNERNLPIAIWQDCNFDHQVHACADGYEAPLSTFVFCSPECPGTDCPTCGACANDPIPVLDGETVERDWAGLTFRFPEPSAACACYERVPAVAGRYRISVPVYPAEPKEQEGGGWYRTALYVVAADFSLPDDDGIVEIAIDESPHVVSCADAGAGFCIARLDPDAAESGCSPAQSDVEPCPSSAPRRFECSEPVPLDPGCVDQTLLGAGSGAVIRCCP